MDNQIEPRPAKTRPAVTGRVYVAYHRLAPLVSGPGLVPIQVGRQAARETLAMIGDDTGAHISGLNPSHCELTAHYWIWKNDLDAAFLGLMHYRRFLDLRHRRHLPSHPERFDLTFDAKAYAQGIAAFLDQPDCDILAPAPTRLRIDLREQYARCHGTGDLDLLEQAVADCRPDFLPDLRLALQGRALRIGNMFIMRRAIFEDYSALLFPVLDRVHVRLESREATRSAYQARYAGFLAERLLTAYLGGQTVRTRFSNLRIRDAAILNIDRDLVARAGPTQRLKWLLRRQIPLRDALRNKI